MTELERSLRALDVDWPSTPVVQLELVPRRRRRTVAALAVVAAAAAAFAVPQSRSAILDFFHLGGVTVVRVETLPPAQERPLSAGLGSAVDDAGAAKILGTAFVPRQHGTLRERDGFVSTVLRGPVLLSEFGSAYLIKKLAAGPVVWVEVAPGVQGLWIAGASHVVSFPGASPRLAGAVLVWERGGVTFRLEGAGLRKEDALRLARELLGTDPG
jgi:hypothetical protein